MSVFFVYAHPDDESFLAAGVCCRLRERGIATLLVTATLGEEGRAGTPPFCTREELPDVRRRELEAACRILGIRELRLLGYRDKRLAEAPPHDVREKLVGLIRSHRPAVVATFDPHGLNAHTDHIAISRFTSDAVAAAADPRYHTETGRPHEIQRLLWTPPRTIWQPGEQPPLGEQPGVDFLIDVSEYAERKTRALLAHRTQQHSIDQLFMNVADPKRLVSYETFRQAFGPRLSRRPAADILEGL